MENEISCADMQRIEFHMLRLLHNICMKHHLRYYMIGGTMLGAVRHGGFIPWDDDIDVGMPREDYETFLRVAPKELPRSVSLRSLLGQEIYQYGYAKLIQTNTVLVEDYYPQYQIGVYLDVFPLDVFPVGREGKRLQRRILWSARLTGWCHYNEELRKLDSLYKYIIKLPLIILAKAFIKPKGLQKKLRSLNAKLASRDTDNADYLFNGFGLWREREVMPKEIFGVPTPIEFEGHTFLGVEKPHEYLTRLYGNYMELPPVEKRESHHAYKVQYREGYDLYNCFDERR